MADMAFGGAGFNPDNVEDEATLPAGEHPVRITASEVKATKSGTGHMLVLEYQVEQGSPHAGRKFWQNINIQNQNPTAQAIGQRELKKICKALGISGEMRNSDVLHNQPFIVVTKVEEDDYGAKTVVKNAKPFANPTGPAGGQQPMQNAGGQGQQAQPMQQPQQQGGGMPWNQ